MPVTVVLVDSGRMPTISTSSLTLITPRSIRPVTTVPRPVMVKTSSTGMRNGLSVSRTGSGMESSTACMRSTIDWTHFSSPSRALRAEIGTTGAFSSNSCEARSSRTSISTSSRISSSSTMSALFRATRM